jgi:hypothetical protein
LLQSSHVCVVSYKRECRVVGRVVSCVVWHVRSCVQHFGPAVAVQPGQDEPHSAEAHEEVLLLALQLPEPRYAHSPPPPLHQTLHRRLRSSFVLLRSS